MREIRPSSAFCTAERHLDMASLISFGSCCALSLSPPPMIPPKTSSRITIDDDGDDDVDAVVQKAAWDGDAAAASRRAMLAHPRGLRDDDATPGLLRSGIPAGMRMSFCVCACVLAHFFLTQEGDGQT